MLYKYILAMPRDVPFLRIQVTAQSSQRKEGQGAVGRVIVLQEPLHVQAEVYSPGQVVRISVYSTNNLGTENKSRT